MTKRNLKSLKNTLSKAGTKAVYAQVNAQLKRKRKKQYSRSYISEVLSGKKNNADVVEAALMAMSKLSGVKLPEWYKQWADAA